MRVATWSMKPLNNGDQKLEKELREHNIDICALQIDMKRKGQSDRRISC